jgi:hypothetical protein
VELCSEEVEGRVVHLEKHCAQIVEHAEDVAQHGEIEAKVLRCCQRLEPAPGEVVAQRMNVDEVPRRSSANKASSLSPGRPSGPRTEPMGMAIAACVAGSKPTST